MGQKPYWEMSSREVERALRIKRKARGWWKIILGVVVAFVLIRACS